MMAADTLLVDTLRRLDGGPFEVANFEANVLHSCLRQQTWASPKQRRILAQMCEKYLHDPLTAAELQGQLRLLGDPVGDSHA